MLIQSKNMRKNQQKFLRGQRVHITKDMPFYMSRFGCDCDAIVQGSYRDQYGSDVRGEDNQKLYSLLLLNKRGKPVDDCSWYEEYQLTLVDGDRDKGEALIQSYNEMD
jgi:hypothetical protein